MTAVLDTHATITEPGVYQLDDETYHADPVVGGSLSSSGARRLLPPSCPAKYRYERDHRDEVAPINRAFNLGHAAHKLVLGAGPELVLIEADNYKRPAIREERDDVIAAGLVPLLTHEWDQVHAMAAALRAHPVSALLDPGTGKAEVTLVWRDEPTGIMCRARVDWLQPGAVIDYKSALSGDTEQLGRSCDQYGYAQQADWYLDGVRALGLGDDTTPFVFIAQEKEPPFLITPFQLDPTALAIGRRRNTAARQIYRHCTDTDYWPGHVYDPEDIVWVSLPPWVERREGELS